MTVEVIRCQIEKQRSFSVKQINSFKLETGNLQNDDIRPFAFSDDFAQRTAYITADFHPASVFLKYQTNQMGSGRFTICTGYRHYRAVYQTVSKFELGNYRDTFPYCLGYGRMTDGNTGADYDKIGLSEKFPGVTAGFQRR